MERKEAIELAQDHLIRVLQSDRIADVNVGTDDNDLYDLLSALRDTRDDFERLEAAQFNSLGILQSTGVSVDVAAAKFSTLSRLAKGALVSYYMQREA